MSVFFPSGRRAGSGSGSARRLSSATGDPPPSASLKSSTQPQVITDSICSFSLSEIEAFNEFAPYANANPRKIKRITNVYTMVRMLLPERVPDEFRKKLIAWIILCEQFPVRMCWIMQHIEDSLQVHRMKKTAIKEQDSFCAQSLSTLYTTVIEAQVYGIKFRQSLPEGFKEKYSKAYCKSSRTTTYLLYQDKILTSTHPLAFRFARLSPLRPHQPSTPTPRSSKSSFTCARSR